MSSNLNIQNFISLAKAGKSAEFKNIPDFKTAPLKNDEFVKQGEKTPETPNAGAKKQKGKNKKAIITGAIIGTIGIIGAAAAYCLLTKNFKPANFKKFVKFKEAATMEDAANFARKNFGVENFDFKDDLELANWVNEGLTNVNNRFKGKANMPKTLGFIEDASEGLAYTNGFKKEIRFSRKKLTKEALLKDFLGKTNGYFERVEKSGNIYLRPKKHPVLIDEKKYKELMMFWHKADMAKQNPDAISRKELLTAIFKYEDCFSIVYNPEGAMHSLLENKEAMKILKEKGIKIDPDKFSALSKKKQVKYLAKIAKKAGGRVKITGDIRSNSPFDIVYHEMGHYQHYANRNLFDDIFGRLSKKSTEKFLKDKNAQKIASKVSWYAKTEPEEFVAEVFNALCAGKKVPGEVMDLYKYYKGPIIPAA